MAYLAGQVALAPDFSVVGDGDLRAQTVAAMRNVQGSQEHPAQTIIGITGLAVPGLMIEIEVTAVLP